MNRTGTILLVHTKDNTQAKLIQKFQSKADQESGRWNHSGILYESPHGLWVVEESQIKGRRLKAAVVLTPFSHYQDRGKYELLYLIPDREIDTARMERVLFSLVGIPYDYFSLIHDQVIRTINDKWVGRKDKAWKRMVCHEMTMYAYEQYGAFFKEYYTGDVSLIFRHQSFIHISEIPQP